MQALTARQLARLLGEWRVAAARGAARDRLAAAVRGLAADGRLPIATRLPAERELALALGLSRSTVTSAYDVLRDEGSVRSRRGAGSWIAGPPALPTPVSTHLPVAIGTDDASPIDMAVASPTAPTEAVLEAVGSAAAALPAYLAHHGYQPAGLPVLRAAIARGYRERGLPTDPTQILVTAGAQGAIDLVARTLLRAGASVLVESPTYPTALDALQRAGGRLVPVGMTEQGWDLDRLLTAWTQTAASLAYVVPDFQNPTGHLLDTDGRAELVRAARAGGGLLLVDEALAQLWLDTAPPPPTAVSDREGRVLTVGSISKDHWGGLRVGWVRASPPLIARLAQARGAVDIAPPVLDQLVAVALLADGGDLLVARRAQLRSRRELLLAEVAAALPQWRVRRPAGGLSLWAELDEPVSTALVQAAGRIGLRLAAGSRFGTTGTFERFLRLPFALPEPMLVESVRRLAQARGRLGASERDVGLVA